MLKWLKSLISGKAPVTNTDCSVSASNNEVIQFIKEASILFESGQDTKAIAMVNKTLATDPSNSDALYIKAAICNRHGDSQQAILLVKKAITSRKSDAFLYRFLGDIYISLSNFLGAAESYERALNIEPCHTPTLLALGSSHEHSRQFRLAEEVFSRVIATEPNNFDAYLKRGEVYLDTGKTELAIANFKKAHELAPFNHDVYSSYLFATNYSTELSAAAIFNAHRKFDQLYGLQPCKVFKALDNKDANKKLRIGYISPDFRTHSVARFFEPILDNHDRSAFEIFCYHVHQSKDEVSARLEDKSDHWLDCSPLSDDEIFTKIQNDQIDILVDLAGHTTASRLLVLSRKPAPIQMTWLGYINTTGLKAIDYRIVDSFSDPAGASEKYHSEKLLRLPNSQWFIIKNSGAIEITRLPALNKGYITFGSFNRFSKLSEKILTLWARTMLEIEASQLIIIDVPVDEHDRIQCFFLEHGINAERLKLYDQLPYDVFLALHNEVDIAFDAHPYSGATTTCDSLWMGVPTLTLIGETSISRSSYSILKNLEMDDWVATSEDEFIALTIQQSGNLDKLSTLRSQLRTRIQSSPIMDVLVFTKSLEVAYRQTWASKCHELAKEEEGD